MRTLTIDEMKQVSGGFSGSFNWQNFQFSETTTIAFIHPISSLQQQFASLNLTEEFMRENGQGS